MPFRCVFGFTPRAPTWPEAETNFDTASIVKEVRRLRLLEANNQRVIRSRKIKAEGKTGDKDIRRVFRFGA